MNITFLIGNGFDLNLGLKTGYKDVLKEYLQEKNKDERVTKFKQKIDEDFENWSDFEKQLGIYTNDFYEFLKETLREVEDFLFCFNNFKEFFLKYLEKEQNYFLDNHKNLETKITTIEKSIFNFYNFLPENSKINIEQKFEDEVFKYIDNNLDPKNNLKYNFISFNYTNILDKFLISYNNNMQQNTTINNNVLHIHGTTKNYPLCGVDNIEQIKYEYFRDKEEILLNLVKTETNKRLRDRRDRQATKLIETSDIICLFGLSLGETDITWWEIIGSWLKKNIGNHLVIFNYDKSFNKINAHTAIVCEDIIENRFCKLAKLTEISEEEKKNIVDRIHIGLNTDLFKIDM